MPTDLTRRSFLAGSAAFVLATACGGGDTDDITVDEDETGAGAKGVSLVVATYVHVAGVADQRVTLALLKGNGPVKPAGPLEVSFKSPSGAVSAAVSAPVHDDGIELPYLLVRHNFDTPGIYDATVRYEGRSLAAPIEVADPAVVKVPFPGQPMIAVPTPTVADARGVNPICTSQPACPLHDVSLDAALGEKRPLAVLFSTPALCQSRLCGPVLDNLLAARDAFADKVRFLHVEIFTDLSGKTLTEPVKAYNLESEPFLFLSGPDGVVRERLDNAYDRAEVRSALERLTA